VPVAATLNEAVCPAEAVVFAGCVVMDGGTLTFSVAAWLVMVEALPMTVTMNSAPLSEAVVAGVVYEAAVAPMMVLPFLYH
jgi:hypothetical protein